MSAFRGKNRKKGDLSVFLAALKAGELAPNPVLILEDMDRLSRDKIKASVDCASAILEAGCDIYSVIERKLYTRACLDEPMGLMGMIWVFYLAHQESEKKAVRSRGNWDAKHKRAKDNKAVFTSICPGWLEVIDHEYDAEGRMVNGRFKLRPDKVKVVKNLFKWCIEGQGTQAIMRRLAREKIPPFRSGWNQKYIWDILKDRRVIGDLPTTVYGDKSVKGEIIPGYYPPIIDQKTFDAAQDAMKSRKGKTGRRGDFINLFTGLVHYPTHGGTMVLLTKPKRNKSGVHQYRYLASFLGWKGLKPYVAVRIERFEQVVLGWLYDIASELIPRVEAPVGVESLKSKRAFLDERIKAVAEEVGKAGVKLAAIFAKVAEMEAEKSALTRQIDDLQQQETRPPLDETKALIDLLKTTTGAELKALRQQLRQRLLLHIEKIDVTVHEGKVWLAIEFKSGVARQVWYDPSSDKQGLWVGYDHWGVTWKDVQAEHLKKIEAGESPATPELTQEDYERLLHERIINALLRKTDTAE